MGDDVWHVENIWASFFCRVAITSFSYWLFLFMDQSNRKEIKNICEAVDSLLILDYAPVKKLVLKILSYIK